MCGIAGLVARGQNGAIRDMTEALRHRGPDDEGIWESPDGVVQLGHRRLSIQDLSSAGHQPMANAEGDVSLVFNGEIYNYPQLAKELREQGVALRSRCDTEAILELYLRHGTDCFALLDGMFAIAIHDGRRNRLVLARDRLGKKPLYWYAKGDTFAFASELSALRAAPTLDLSIDPHALLAYLQFDYVPTPGTIYRNTRKLMPGRFLVVDDPGGRAELREEAFWSLDPDARFEGGYEDACAELDRRLDEAVRCRLLSDVPVGVFLSGGLDSSTVAHYAARHHSGIETFAMGFEDATYDESGYARKVAEHLGTRHREWIVTANDLITALQSGGFIDEPLGDASIIPTYLLAKQVREHVTVALGGDGGDELFAGYPTFTAERVARRVGALPRSIWSLAEKAVDVLLPPSTGYLSNNFAARKFLAGVQVPPRLRHQCWLGAFPFADAVAMLQPALRAEVADTAPYQGLDTWAPEIARWEERNGRLYEYLRTYLMDEVMVKVDRASMAVSLEARSPLLDHRVVELAFSLPYEWKLGRGGVKRILKDLMRPHLPEMVIERPKKGFGIPVAQWFRHELRDWAREQLAGLEAIGIDAGRALALHDRHVDGSEDLRKPLWNLVALSRFSEAASRSDAGRSAR